MNDCYSELKTNRRLCTCWGFLSVFLFWANTALGQTENNPPDKSVATPPPATHFSPSNTTAVLRVASSPPGADIYVSRYRRYWGEHIGKAPVEKELSVGRYFVRSKMDGYANYKADIQLDPNEIQSVNFSMQRSYPRRFYKKLGHFLFWPGIVLA